MAHQFMAIINLNCFYNRGAKDSSKDPFRKWCGAVGEIRSLLPQGVPMLALTATASAGTRKKVIQMLCLNRCVKIAVSPNRENIKIYLQKVKDDISDNFMWIVHELEEQQLSCRKLLIYVRDFQRCSEIYHLLMQSLGDKAYYPPGAPKTSCNRMVAMYHSGTSHSIQETVLASLKDSNGKVRVIIATSALGMGVDIKGLYRIVNYGPPSDVESYIQELGRAGRDGHQSETLLLFHGRQLRLCTPEMLQYLKSTSCRRNKLISIFDDSGDVSFAGAKHLCCDICEMECDCGATECPDLTDSMVSLKAHLPETATSELKVRQVSEGQKASLKDLLKECQKRMRDEVVGSNPNLFYGNVDNITCFSNHLIEDTVSKCDALFSVDDILDQLSLWKVDHAHIIYNCLCNVFPDLHKEGAGYN